MKNKRALRTMKTKIDTEKTVENKLGVFFHRTPSKRAKRCEMKGDR